MKPKFNFWLEKDGEVALSITTPTFNATSTNSAKSPSPPNTFIRRWKQDK